MESHKTGLTLLRQITINSISGLTTVLCLIGAVTTRHNDLNKSMFLLTALSQSIIVLVSANGVEQAELTHNDVLDIESQARVNKLAGSLIYGQTNGDYSAQLWAVINEKLNEGYSLEMVLPILSSDRDESLRILAGLEARYNAKLR